MSTHANRYKASDPFDSHFAVSDEVDASKKIQAARENKWGNAKKELSDGLRVVRAVPAANESNVSLVPAMKDLAGVKVSDATSV